MKEHHASHSHALSFHLADLTQSCSHVVQDNFADLVVDKSTLDCLLCSDGAPRFVYNVHQMLTFDGYYVVISFHPKDFLISFLSLAFTVESITNLERHVGPDVVALVLRKAVSIDPEELLSRLEAWNVQLSSPMLSDDRLQALKAAWCQRVVPPTERLQAALPLREAYDVMITAADACQEEPWSFPCFESNQKHRKAVGATLSMINKLEEVVKQEAETAEKGRGATGAPVGTKPVQTVLQTFVREWSSEGAQERQACFDRLLGAVGHLPKASRVLVPSCCLGRLAHEVACRGHSVEATEGRLLHWFGMELLRRNPSPEAFRPQPFALNTCNRLKFMDNHRVTPVPELAIKEGLLPPVRFGEFTAMYGKSEAKECFDCLLTAYALDLSPNVFRFVRTAAHVLRPGGMWANFGPLAYDTDHDEAHKSGKVCGF
eukprot:symbB.v1.2.001623.t1/scaffold80.1/size342472/10